MALIGYAEADFYSLITKGHYYVDRTSFIARLENLGNRNLLFARPRRFGKSLWISTLEHYYDVRFKDEFDMLFGNFYIGKNPTPNRNNYVVLRIQFSGIDVATYESAYSGYLKNVKTGVKECMQAHLTYYTSADIAELDMLDSPESVVQWFFSCHKSKRLPYKLYTLILRFANFL